MKSNSLTRRGQRTRDPIRAPDIHHGPHDIRVGVEARLAGNAAECSLFIEKAGEGKGDRISGHIGIKKEVFFTGNVRLGESAESIWGDNFRPQKQVGVIANLAQISSFFSAFPFPNFGMDSGVSRNPYSVTLNSVTVGANVSPRGARHAT